MEDGKQRFYWLFRDVDGDYYPGSEEFLRWLEGTDFFTAPASTKYHLCTPGGLVLHNRLKEARAQKKLSQAQLAQLVGVSRNTISSIETGQFNPTAKLALILCIALDKKFEDLFYFD